MKLTKTDINDCYIVEWDRMDDNRGFFNVSFNTEEFYNKTGIDFKIIQENESMSKKGVIRGLHFQKPPYEQAKLVRCVYGQVLDVIVDIRPDSPSYAKIVTVQLNGGLRRSVLYLRVVLTVSRLRIGHYSNIRWIINTIKKVRVE